MRLACEGLVFIFLRPVNILVLEHATPKVVQQPWPKDCAQLGFQDSKGLGDLNRFRSSWVADQIYERMHNSCFRDVNKACTQ
jgi:hypothetical protein